MNFHFKSEEETEEMRNILKCLYNLCSIPEGSMPCARGIGLSWTSLSEILPDMENDYATEIISKVNQFEPRVKVIQVSFSQNEELGSIDVLIEIERAEEDVDY